MELGGGNNSSIVIIVEPLNNDSMDRLVAFAISYIVMGVLLIVTNLPIVGAVLKHPVIRFRKEYIIFAGNHCRALGMPYCTLRFAVIFGQISAVNEAR